MCERGSDDRGGVGAWPRREFPFQGRRAVEGSCAVVARSDVISYDFKSGSRIWEGGADVGVMFTKSKGVLELDQREGEG
jgi:hypothetical protein